MPRVLKQACAITNDNMGGSAMINKFHVLYVGQIELDNIGLNGTPANERRYSDERLREAFFTARDVAQTMDELGFDVLWTAEHHFQREGYEVFPNLIQLGLVARDADQAAEVRLRLQRAADVASDPPGRGLRDGRHRHRRAHRDGRRARLSHPRGGELRRAAARRQREPRAVRGAARAAAQVLQRGRSSTTRASSTRRRRRSSIAATP